MGEAGAPLLAGPSDYSYISGLGRIDWIEDAHNKATR